MSRLIALCCRLVLIASVGIGLVAAILFGRHFPQFILMVAAIAGWRRYRLLPAATSHGSARTCETEEILENGLLANHGLVLGTTAYCDRPGKLWAIRTLFSPYVKSV